jgi:hypothetical protein
MTNPEIPVGRQAVRAWKRLDADVRKDVWRRALKGLGHPDPAVAVLAVVRARCTLSHSFSVRYWGCLFIVLTGVVGLVAVLDRLTSLDPDHLYVIAITISFSSGIRGYTGVRREAKQLEEANLNTLRAGHTDDGSLD